MKINLSKQDALKFLSLSGAKAENLLAVNYIAEFLTKCSDYITADMISEIVSRGVDEECAFAVSLAGVLNFDITSDEGDKKFFHDYIFPSVKLLDTEKYKSDPYSRNIRVPQKAADNWEMKPEGYKPYEAFIYNDILFKKNYKELPCLGFFNKSFLYPAVLEGGREWMSIKPNEIETIRPVAEASYGKVVTFGLGLGYYAYLASEKPDVERVTIIELDSKVIELFERYILPQFGHKDKIEIICADAFDFAKNMRGFDFAFTDIWHDAQDGIDMYVKMKRIARRIPGTEFTYWIENTMIQNLRWYLYEGMAQALMSGKGMFPLLGIEIKDYESAARCLTREFISNNADKILTEE